MIEQISTEIYSYILNKNETKVFYQPIISISKRESIGHESLLRATYMGESIPPDLLFSYSRIEDEVSRLDNICQELALSDYTASGQNSLLFINMETSLLSYYLKYDIEIVQRIDSLSIPHNKIVFEINEKKATNDSLLLELVTKYRKFGFVIALDDVGAGYSNLNRIVLAKPDIIKVDRSVVCDIHENYYKREVLKAITELGQKIGAITIAEGVEKLEEVVSCVECGVDWFQGFYFSKAQSPFDVKGFDFSVQCTQIAETYQKSIVEKMNLDHTLIRKRKFIFEQLYQIIINCIPSDMENAISSFLQHSEDLECIYLIDESGYQLTETLFHPRSEFRNRTMFSPMKKGDHHISKPFFNYALHNPGKTYFSVKYISLATGNYCQTISKLLITGDSNPIILCADFKM